MTQSLLSATIGSVELLES